VNVAASSDSRISFVYISAAEASSDAIAATIVREWLLKNPDLRFCGVGGPELRKIPEFQCWQNAEEMRVMGFSELLGSFVRLRRIFRELVERVRSVRPQMGIVFDYPDFHLRFLKAVEDVHECTWIDAIPPKMWVWRKGRAKTLHGVVHGVISLFTFEANWLRRIGFNVISEGHPLCDRPAFKKSIDEARKELQLETTMERGPSIELAAFPGSRPSEIRLHARLFSDAAELLAKESKKKVILSIPVPEIESMESVKQLFRAGRNVEFRWFQGKSDQVLRAHRLGWIKSGTSTLEATWAGCFPIIVYSVSKTTEWIFKYLIRYRGPVGLPNILLGIQERRDAVFPELLGPEATAENLVKMTLQQVLDRDGGEMALRSFVPQVEDVPVAKRIAAALESWRLNRPERQIFAQIESKLWIAVLSWSWSVVNSLVRWVRRPLKELPNLKTCLVGNLQAGGSGKSPIIRLLVQQASKHKIPIAVISRGYGRQSRRAIWSGPGSSPSVPDLGDELCDLKLKFPDLLVVATKNRLAALKELKKRQFSGWVLLDDGFQTVSFRPLLTLLACTPRSRSETVYRDFFGVASACDAAVWIKGRGGPLSSAPVQHFELKTQYSPKVSGPLVALLAVGDPVSVLHSLRDAGYFVLDALMLEDHASISPETVRAVIDRARSLGATPVCTSKDAVKIKDLSEFIVIEQELTSNAPFHAFVLEKLS
jgi:lipid-A-disaccharide synthase